MISKYFSWTEVTASDTAARLGIDNTLLSPRTKEAASITAAHMDIVREFLGHPIHVNSWYRCLELNSVIGSKATSQHPKGEAVDFICPAFGTPAQICAAILASNLDFDQLIMEHTWVHISFSSMPNVHNRRQVLTLLKDGTYAKGL
jgi:hypothetical protein